MVLNPQIPGLEEVAAKEAEASTPSVFSSGFFLLRKGKISDKLHEVLSQLLPRE